MIRMKTVKETAAEHLLELQINNKIFDRHIEELKAILTTLESENKQKTQVLESFKKGSAIKSQTAIDDKRQPLKYPCKLSDLRLEIPNLDPKIREDHLKEYFDKFGDVIDVYIEVSPEMPIGFVIFSCYYNERPQKHHVLNNIPVRVEHVLHNDEKDSRTIVIIGGSDICELSGSDFRKYFKSFGVIADFRRTVSKETRKLSRFVFIEFTLSSDVEKILEKKDHTLEGVDVSIFSLPSC